MPPKKVAELSGYPVRHVYAPNPSPGSVDCYYTVEEVGPAVTAQPYPMVRLWIPPSVEIDMECSAGDNSGDDRCSNPAGVGDQARLESDWKQDQTKFDGTITDIRQSELIVSAGGKWFFAGIEAKESPSTDGSREQGLLKIAALLRETHDKAQ